MKGYWALWVPRRPQAEKCPQLTSAQRLGGGDLQQLYGTVDGVPGPSKYPQIGVRGPKLRVFRV